MNNPVPIPESFMIFGKTHHVVYDQNLAGSQDAVGRLSYDTGLIQLLPNCATSPRCEAEIEQTFFHELVHAALQAVGAGKLSGDEELVDLMASALHQAFKTATYPAAAAKRAKR